MVPDARRIGRAEQELGRHLVDDVVGLERVPLVILIQLALKLVAARFAEHLALHARRRHLGALADRPEEYFFERAVVDVEAGAGRALCRVDAFDEDAVLAAVAVRRVAGLRTGPVPADVDARHRDAGRHGEQRPQVARVRDLLQRFQLEVLLHASRRGVDDRRLARDRHRLLKRRDLQVDVDRRGEPHRDLDVLALQRVEARQFI